MNLPIGLFTGLAQGLEEQIPIGFRPEDVCALVAPAHDVIERPFIFQSEFSSHSEEEKQI